MRVTQQKHALYLLVLGLIDNSLLITQCYPMAGQGGSFHWHHLDFSRKQGVSIVRLVKRGGKCPVPVPLDRLYLSSI